MAKSKLLWGATPPTPSKCPLVRFHLYFVLQEKKTNKQKWNTITTTTKTETNKQTKKHTYFYPNGDVTMSTNYNLDSKIQSKVYCESHKRNPDPLCVLPSCPWTSKGSSSFWDTFCVLVISGKSTLKFLPKVNPLIWSPLLDSWLWTP